MVRSFGGVQLGAGGLVRAHPDAVAQALVQAEKVPLMHWLACRCALPYALEGALRRALDGAPVRALEISHANDVAARFEVDQAAWPALRERLEHLGQGRLTWDLP